MVKKELYGLYLRAKYLMISFRLTGELHLLDKVIYKGKDCFINNMIRYDSKGRLIYDILSEEIGEDGKRKGWAVTRNQFSKKLCWFNLENGAMSYYRWWRRYWYESTLKEMMDRSIK